MSRESLFILFLGDKENGKPGQNQQKGSFAAFEERQV